MSRPETFEEFTARVGTARAEAWIQATHTELGRTAWALIGEWPAERRDALLSAALMMALGIAAQLAVGEAVDPKAMLAVNFPGQAGEDLGEALFALHRALAAQGDERRP